MSVPKKVTAGWARRDVMCRALCCLFLIFEQRSYCPASKSRTSWPPTPAKTNSGKLTCYRFLSKTTLRYLVASAVVISTPSTPTVSSRMPLRPTSITASVLWGANVNFFFFIQLAICPIASSVIARSFSAFSTCNHR
jgi:hypothetical protein